MRTREGSEGWYMGTRKEAKTNKLTPPADEHIKSTAIPQQWSLVPGQAQSLVQ